MKMKTKIKSLIKKVVIGAIILSFAGIAYAGGFPHNSYGNVTGGNNSISLKFYVPSRPTEVLTEVLSGSFYFVQVAGLPTTFTPGIDDSVAIMWKETGAGTISHAGSYAVMNETLTSNTPQQYADCTVRAIPVPTATANAAQARIELAWTNANQDNYENPPTEVGSNGNTTSTNVTGYNIYRSTNGISFTKINGSLVTGTSYNDTTGTAGTTYYYAIELVFKGGIVAGSGTAILSANTNSVIYPTVTVNPTVTSANPNNRPQGWTGNVVIAGSNFLTGAAVTFSGSGITVNSTTFNTASQLTANISIASGASTGSRNITATNPGGANGTGNNLFTVNAAPTITSVNPTNLGQGATNQDIVITGTGFQSGATVAFSGSGVTVNSTTFNNSTQVTTNISISSSAATGTRNITLTNPDTGQATGNAIFTVNVGPTVTSANPNSGDQGETLNVTITGSNFQNGATVSFSGSGITVNSTNFVSATELGVNITLAAGATIGARNITVVNPDRGQATGNNLFTVDAAPGNPVVTVTPNINFSATVGNNPAPDSDQATISVTNATLNTWTAGAVTYAPGGPTGWVTRSPINGGPITAGNSDNLTVTIGDVTGFTAGTYTAEIPITFSQSVTAQNVVITLTIGSTTPVVDSVSKTTLAEGETISIRGSNFGSSRGTSTVSFGGVTSLPSYWSSSQIIAAVPNGAGTDLIVTVNSQNSNTTTLTIDPTKVVIDDIEGGSVGHFSASAPTSGYYEFDKYDATYSPVPSTSYPDRAKTSNTVNIQEGSLAMEVLYSYGMRAGEPNYVADPADDWGGGWGGLLANTIDVSAHDTISIWLKGEGTAGTANRARLEITDTDGTVFANSNPTDSTAGIALNFDGYQKFSVPMASFVINAVSTTGNSGDTTMDWTNIAKYAVIYNTQNANPGNLNHYVDTVYAETASVNQPTLSSIAPNSANKGQTLNVILTGTNTSWSGDMASAISFSSSDITINSATADSATQISANISVASNATLGAGTVSVTGAQGTATFTISDMSDPVILGLSLATAEVGQTVVVSGYNFGASKESTSVIRFGTTIANPTKWANDSITVAIPSGLPTGEVAVVVYRDGKEGSSEVTIPGNKIYLDDFEGGSVGAFPGNGLADSGYYVFTDVADITPDNSNINADLHQAEAAYAGNFGAKVLFSYDGTDATPWGGGWGAQLANTLDLSQAESINLFIKWDGSTNEVTIALSDEDGTSVANTISNATLMSLTSTHGEIPIAIGNFVYDVAGSAVTADTTFDWSKVVNYNILYKTQGTSTTYHYVDDVVAYLPSGNPATGVRIDLVDPQEAPAGSNITVYGREFGVTQGNSSLFFENDKTGVTFTAQVTSWSDRVIKAVVPRTALADDYSIKVIKLAITAGNLTAQESNTEAFKVTASSSGDGIHAYPNPFNPISTDPSEQIITITFNPGTATNIGVYYYDMTARLVIKQTIASGQTTWDGRDEYNNWRSDGAYIVRVVDENSKRLIAKGKILLIKE